MPPKTPDDLRDKVIELARAGRTRVAIRDETGLALDTIRAILSEYGIMPRRRAGTIDDEVAEKALRLHQEGRSLSVISAVTGLTYSQIAKLVREYDGPLNAAEDYKEISPQKFIQTWQESSAIGEVAYKLGIPINRVRARASLYRARGVPLRDYRRSGGYNWGELADFAQSFMDDDGEPTAE